MDEALILIYLIFLAGLGHLWLHGRTVPRWDQLPWDFGAGAVFWGYGQFLLNVLNLPNRGVWSWLWPLAALAWPLLARRSASLLPWPPAKDAPASSVPPAILWAGAGLLGLALLTAILHALARPMHLWDSIVIYGFKSKILFHEGTFKTPAFLDSSVLHYSKDYPLLIPYLESGYYRWLGHPNDRTVRLLFTAYWAAWMGLVYQGLRWRLPRSLALGIVAFIATLPLFSALFMGQASSGFADIPFAFYWLGFLLCGVRMMNGDRSVGGVAVLLALGVLFAKNEGVPAVLGGGVLFAWAIRDHRRIWISACAAVGILILPWLWTRDALPHNSAHHAALWTGSAAMFGERLGLMGRALLRELSAVHQWGAFWLLVLAGAMLPARRFPWPREARILLAAILAQAAAYGYVYLTYTQDLALLLPITQLRLLLHLVGPLVVAIGWRCREGVSET